jgi:hypothetical protein
MSERILTELQNIKDKDKDLHSHLKTFISKLLIDREDLTNFEAYSAQHRISNGVTESVFKVR